MAEYIERNGLLKWTREFYPEEKVFASAVINAPTADVQEVRHGKWIKEYLSYGAIRYRCSVCNGMFSQNMIEFSHKNFCSNCGAKMLEKVGDEV